VSRPFIGLCKARSGGEWLPAALAPVPGACDGVVFVRDEDGWVPAVELQDDCGPAIEAFTRAHPDLPVLEVHGQWPNQGDQYRAGLSAIRERWGEDAAVFVFDTDEIWTSDNLRALRNLATTLPPKQFVQGRLRAYVRSPLYRIWPKDPGQPAVALCSAKDRAVRVRFAGMAAENAAQFRPPFDHMTYVRLEEETLHRKFLSTASQEIIPSDYSWWDRVWPRLPWGTDIHMTCGHEVAWKRLRPCLPSELPPALAAEGAFRLTRAAEDARWREFIETQDKDDTLVPTPAWDAGMYDHELAALVKAAAGQARHQAFADRIKSTNYEALVLAYLSAGRKDLLEIGSGSGGSMLSLAFGSGTGRVTCIDPFLPYDEQTAGGIARGVQEGHLGQFGEALGIFGLHDRVALIRKASADAAAEIPNASQGLVLIDGNHSEWAVALDMRLYWDKVAPGGLMLLHDFTTRFPGVPGAVRTWERLAGHKGKVWQATSLWMIEKPA